MLTAVVLLCVPPPPITAAFPAPGDTVEIQEWLVPWPNTRPRDPYVGPDGLVWFVGQKADYVASFVGHEPNYAVFVGLYERGNALPMTLSQ